MEDFSLPEDLQFYVCTTEKKFKDLLKGKAREYAFEKFLQKKKTHSKMKRLKYQKLIIQTYLLSKSLTIYEKKMIMKWRVFMEKFGQNFRGGRELVLCPLCRQHRDGEEESFNSCSETRKHVDIRGTFNEIFAEDISKKTVMTMTRILTFRDNIMK